jgi:phosphoadenosine phosphosulfate reductase
MTPSRPIRDTEWADSDNVALEFSGGRDSLACLYLLKPWLDGITVYWLDSGDNFPETYTLVDRLRAWIPNFVTVKTNRDEILATDGWPTDVMPAQNSDMGMLVDNPRLVLQSRYDCCAKVIMTPLHQAVVSDKVNVIIRGQRLSDKQQNPIRHGENFSGIRYLYPIDEWSDEDVMDYLQDVGAPIPPYYSVLSSAPDCMTCTGWLEEGRSRYMRDKHPTAYAEYQRRLRLIATELQPHLENLLEETS